MGLLFIWRRYWGKRWFWGTMLTVAVVHFILLKQIHDLLNRQNIIGMFSLAVIEALIISAVMSVPIHFFAKETVD